MKRKPLIVILICVLLAILAFAIYIYKATYDGSHDESEMYEETLITYLEAMKEGTDNAIKYTAFPNEIIEYDYLHSPIRIIDYEVVSSTQINENLHAFTLNIADSDQPDVYTPLYYFVGYLDGRYIVYINASYVPDELHKNFDANVYSYSNPNYLEGVPVFD